MIAPVVAFGAKNAVAGVYGGPGLAQIIPPRGDIFEPVDRNAVIDRYREVIATMESDFQEGHVSLVDNLNKEMGRSLEGEDLATAVSDTAMPIIDGLSNDEKGINSSQSFIFRVERHSRNPFARWKDIPGETKFFKPVDKVLSLMDRNYDMTTQHQRYYMVTFQTEYQSRLDRPSETVIIKRIMPPRYGKPLATRTDINQRSGWDELRWEIDTEVTPIHYHRIRPRVPKEGETLHHDAKESISINTVSQSSEGNGEFAKMIDELRSLQRVIVEHIPKPETLQSPEPSLS